MDLFQSEHLALHHISPNAHLGAQYLSYDLAQSMGFPGEPDHQDCLKVTDDGTDTIHAAGKFRNEDVLVSVEATHALRDAVHKMLNS